MDRRAARRRPTPERVEAMLAGAWFGPDDLLGVEPVKARVLTAEKVAINAVMAGCLPADFPVVATAVTALCRPELLVHGATASTGGCAILLVVNGPDPPRARDVVGPLGPGRARPGVGVHRARRAPRAAQPARRPARRTRPVHAGAPGQAVVVRRRGRGGRPPVAVAGRRARRARRRLGGDRVRRVRAPADHERVDDRPGRDPGHRRGRDQGHDAPLLDLGRQLRGRVPTAAVRRVPPGRLVEGRHPPVRVRARRRPPIRLGGGGQGGGRVRRQPPPPSTAPCRPPTTCSSWRRAARPGASPPSSRRGSARKSAAVTEPIGVCVDC